MGEVLTEALCRATVIRLFTTRVFMISSTVCWIGAAYDYARGGGEYPAGISDDRGHIDLHRDGVDGQKFQTEIDGKPTSMIMFL